MILLKDNIIIVITEFYNTHQAQLSNSISQKALGVWLNYDSSEKLSQDFCSHVSLQVYCRYFLNSSMCDKYLSSVAVCNHGNGSLDTEGAALPVTQPVYLPLKLRPHQEPWLTCAHTCCKVTLQTELIADTQNSPLLSFMYVSKETGGGGYMKNPPMTALPSTCSSSWLFSHWRNCRTGRSLR